MNEQSDEQSYTSAAAMPEGLDVVLAVLLLSRRLHIEDLAIDGSDRAKVALSGEAIMQGLSTVAQLMSALPLQRDRVEVKSKEAKPDESVSTSVWQALKEFALPPPVSVTKKK